MGALTQSSGANPALLCASRWMIIAFIPLWACSGPAPEGLAPTPAGTGPTLIWDVLAKPLPEIPLPNDAATRLDPGSPTGRRLNVSAQAVTAYERLTRARFNRLDGFGTLGPITMRFSGPLDTAAIAKRHNDNDDFRDDAFFLLNVDKDCARYGEEVALDLDRGRFPITLFSRGKRIADKDAPAGYRVDANGNKMFAFDPFYDHNNLLFAEQGGDLDGDGVDEVANLDIPGACDAHQPATDDWDRCIADHLMTWYERATNTAILRPVWPLEQRCTYAVVVTNRVVGVDGAAVRSPFPFVHPREHQQALKPIVSLLPRYGLKTSDVAFAWTFTTGSMTSELEALRKGLHGHGQFARLHDEFPVTSAHFWSAGELAADGEKPTDPDKRLFNSGCEGAALTTKWARVIDEFGPNMCALGSDFAHVASIFGGTFEAPDLLVDRDGHATAQYPADDDEVWQLDVQTGAAVYGRAKVTWWCALPRATDNSCSPGNPEGKPFCKPFPVILYAHGYGGSRQGADGYMGRNVAMGYASCAMDSRGHGSNYFYADSSEMIVRKVLAEQALKNFGGKTLMNLLLRGRDRDLNNDGTTDPGGDMWTANLFHTRDMVRQSVLEYIQLVRILRAMDGTQRGADGQLLGDIDGDGTIELGGPENTIGMWGISLGGIIAAVLAGAEPSLDAVVPNAGGAGLTDIAMRLGQGGLAEAVALPISGPFMVGCLAVDGHQRPLLAGEGKRCLPKKEGPSKIPAGQLQLGWFAHDVAKFRVRRVATIDGVAVGDKVIVRNVDNGESRSGHINERGWFRLAIPADALNPVPRRALLGLKDGDKEPIEFKDTPQLGDRVEVTVFIGDTDKVRQTVSTFGYEVTFQGTIYPAGAPLVALQEGLGHGRNNPEFRRFFQIAQHAIAPADPGVWAPRYFMERMDSSYDPNAPAGRMHMLALPTIGDVQVPVATGLAHARSAGLLGSWRREPAKYGPEHGWRQLFSADPRYGMSIDAWLRSKWVVEGDARFRRHDGHGKNPHVLYDPDNDSDGTIRFSCGKSDWSASNGESMCPADLKGKEVYFDVPNPAPGKALRINRGRSDGSFDAMRIPLVRPAGQHGVYNSQPFRTWDADTYAVNFLTRFMGKRGRDVSHEPGCDCSAAGISRFQINGEISHISLQGTACSGKDLKVCSNSCAQAWGLAAAVTATCSY